MKRASLAIANAVGTPVAAILFAVLAFVSLPEAVRSGDLVVIVSWIAQTFLQLVLLAVILFAQNEGAKSTERLIRETHDASLEMLADITDITKATHAHLTKES